MTRDEWIKLGVDQGYCYPQRCIYHDGTEPVRDEFTNDEPCILMLQLIEHE